MSFYGGGGCSVIPIDITFFRSSDLKRYSTMYDLYLNILQQLQRQPSGGKTHISCQANLGNISSLNSSVKNINNSSACIHFHSLSFQRCLYCITMARRWRSSGDQPSELKSWFCGVSLLPCPHALFLLVNVHSLLLLKEWLDLYYNTLCQ